MSHGVLPKEIAAGTRLGLAPLARRLHALGVTANGVTVIGLAFTIAGSLLLASERPIAALLVLLVGTLADTLDGQLARVAGGGTTFGAFLDSTLDRVSDAVLAAAIAWLGAARGDQFLFWAAIIALISSFLVSYVRAKAESMGLKADVGLAPREARLTILLVGVGVWGVFDLFVVFGLAVTIVALLSTVTWLQRVAHVAATLRSK